MRLEMDKIKKIRLLKKAVSMMAKSDMKKYRRWRGVVSEEKLLASVRLYQEVKAFYAGKHNLVRDRIRKDRLTLSNIEQRYFEALYDERKAEE